MKELRLVVISGPSGAGKSTAVKVLEDLGFFCVDNMPVTLLPKFMEILSQTTEISRVAVVVDVREREFLKEFPGIFKEIKNSGYASELIYLDSTDESLQRRFSETRRKHPLGTVTVAEGVKAERALLSEIRSVADKIIDTSAFNVHRLSECVRNYFSPGKPEALTLNFLSFGYRYGVPSDADMAVDVRFLPNPYFVEELKKMSGLDAEVRGFLMSKPEAKDFMERFKSFLGYLLPLYAKEGKSYFTVAIGCTGGHHRSVAVAEAMGEAFRGEAFPVKVRHRDVDKD